VVFRHAKKIAGMMKYLYNETSNKKYYKYSLRLTQLSKVK